MNLLAAGVCAIALMASVGCANTFRGAKQDTEKAAEAMAAGAETFDVKAGAHL